jgi:RND superfamily putative drug exporter
MIREETQKHARFAFLQAYGRLVYRFRWLILTAWCVLFCAGLPLAGAVPTALTNSGYTIEGSDSSRVANLLVSTLHYPKTQVLAVFQSSTILVTDPTYQEELSAFVARMWTFPHVVSVTSSGPGQDGRSAFVTLDFDQDADTVASHLSAIRALLPQRGPAQAVLTGEAAATNEVQRDTQQGLQTAELIAMPLTLLVLVFVFGSLVASLLPLLLAAVAVVVSLATIDVVTWYTSVNIFAQSLITVLGLGLAIDYSLLLLRRFREELAHGAMEREAMLVALTTAGEAIVMSGMTVVVGFAGLLLVGIGVMTSFSLAGMAVASTAVLAALTLLPALLSVLGSRVNALRIPRVARLFCLPGMRRERTEEKAPRSFWREWAYLVMAHPWVVIVGASALLTLLAWPTLTLNPGLPGAEALPTGSEARHGLEIMQTQFPSVHVDPIFVLAQTLDGSSMLAPHNLERLAALSQLLEEQKHVRSVTGLFRLPGESVQAGVTLSQAQFVQLYRTGAYQCIPQLANLVQASTAGNTTLLSLQVDTVAGSPADQALIDHFRSLDPRATGFKLLVGGPRVVTLDFDRVLYHNFTRALVFILVATYLLLLCMFRSLFLPLKAIAVNVLSIGAAYGVLIFIFQEGHFAALLDFTADGYLDRFIPLILFCLLSGLSMDYEIFLLSRVREEYRRTGANTQAVALGLEKTGGVITNAALLFLIVSGAFLSTNLIVTKELGLGISVAVFIDATIVRCLLVPATMRVLGRWNW